MKLIMENWRKYLLKEFDFDSTITATPKMNDPGYQEPSKEDVEAFLSGLGTAVEVVDAVFTVAAISSGIGIGAVVVKQIAKQGVKKTIKAGMKKHGVKKYKKMIQDRIKKRRQKKIKKKKPKADTEIPTVNIKGMSPDEQMLTINNHLTGKIYDQVGAASDGQSMFFRGITGNYNPARRGMSTRGDTYFFTDDINVAIKYATPRGGGPGTVIGIRAPMSEMAEHINWSSVLSNMKGVNSEIPISMMDDLISRGFGAMVRIQ
jgi:hypothetical protein